MRTRAMLLLLVLTACPAATKPSSYEGVSDAYFTRRQLALKKTFGTPSFAAAYRKHAVKFGDPFARLIIPKLGVDLYVVEGINGDSLRAGAGHYPTGEYPGSVFPDETGNVCIAGHRTGFGEPFAHLDTLARGDQATLVTPRGRYEYELASPFDGHSNPWVTGPTDVSVLSATPKSALTLTTTDPPHTSKNRLIARFNRVP